MNRFGSILMVSGFLLLGLRNSLTRITIEEFYLQVCENWPLFLIVIGFICSSSKKKRKSHHFK